MKELSNQSVSHSEFQFDGTISVSAWYRKFLKCLQVCVPENSQNIAVDKNNPQINTLVFKSSICASSERFNFCRKFLKTFSRDRWKEICILWNFIFDLPIWMSSPRSSFLGWACKFATPPQFPVARRLSVILLPLLRVRCWVLVAVSRQFPAAGWKITLIQFLILRAARSTRILRRSFLCAQEVPWN